jgi:hypothetical protein
MTDHLIRCFLLEFLEFMREQPILAFENADPNAFS